MNPYERALLDLLIERRLADADPGRIVQLTAHDKEVARLAQLLNHHHLEFSAYNCVGIVWDLLASYRPTLEWKDETPDSEVWSDDPVRRIPGVRYITARVSLGGRSFRYHGRLMGERSSQEVEPLKKHIRVKLGHAIARWMDGLEPDGD